MTLSYVTVGEVFVALISVISMVYWYLTINNEYWKSRNVAYVKPDTIFGSFKDMYLRKISFPQLTIDIYNKFQGERYCGYFACRTPIFLVRDVALIDRILTSDFAYFHDRISTTLNFRDKLSRSLFTAKGCKWRVMRYKLNNAFTQFKVKGMFNQILHCSDNIIKKIEEEMMVKEEFDMLPLTLQFAIDVSCSCTFGICILTDSPQRTEFSKVINRVFMGSVRASIVHALKHICPEFFGKPEHQLLPKSVEAYFENITKAAIRYRKEKNIQRPDFLGLFLTLKEEEESGKFIHVPNSKVPDYDFVNDQSSDEFEAESKKSKPEVAEKVFTEGSIAASLLSFLYVGSEYISNTVAYALLELAKNSDIQRRLQEEVDTIIEKYGEWNYSSVKEMVYLDQIIQETMRLHTVSSPLIRCVTKKYRVPDSDLVLEPDQIVVIPTAAIHRDSLYYSSPLQFNPDRFINNHYKSNPAFIPFGNGPRFCIVMQFAILELKLCVAKIVSKYSFTLSSKTKLPVRKDPRSRHSRPYGGIWLTFQEREKN